MSKHLGTLNVNAGDAGVICLEISADTPLERIVAVLRFADDMTTELAVDEPAATAETAGPPPITKTKRAQAPSAPKASPAPAAISCDVCGRTCSGNRGFAIHRKAMHPDAASVDPDGDDPSIEEEKASYGFGPHDLALRCSDCDYSSAPTAFGTGLKRHVEKEHGRHATKAELEPRTQADVDAAEVE